MALPLLLGTARLVSAHVDPPGCFQTGPGVSVLLFRADGVTAVVGSVQDCEDLVYRTVLSKAFPNDPTICAFSGGTFSLTTPDGVQHAVSGNVPCLGGTAGEGCVSGVESVSSAPIPYTVNPLDVVGGFIMAQGVYTGGVSHDSPANTAGVSASTTRSTPVVACAATTTVTTSSTTTTTIAPLPRSVCSSIKLATAAKLALALGKCDAKAVKQGAAVVQECRDKATTKFGTKWTAAETKGDCLTTADQATVESIIDSCNAALAGALVP